MKQAIRTIGWAIYILWLVLIVFTVTAVYSAFQLAQGMAFGELQTNTSGGTMTLLLPFSVDNNGLYDISNLNITTIVLENNGALVSKNSTVVPLISNGNKVNATHNISIGLENMASDSLSRLLFYDTDLDVELSFALRYARVIPLEISRNFAMAWGAPLYNLTIGDVTVNPYNSTHVRAILPLSFKNHSSFSLSGTVRTEIVNTLNQRVGGSTTLINALPQSSYSTYLPMLVSAGYGVFKEAHLYFDTSVFGYGPKVIQIG